jgi:hypothetical protein
MSKVLIGVFTGIFIGAVVYELVNRTNPELIKKLEKLTSDKIDNLCGVPAGAATEAHEAA